MIYQIWANFLFDTEDEARDFFHDCEMAYPKTRSVNPDSENSEYSSAVLIENHHDEDPNQPCELISFIPNLPPPPE